MAKPTPNPKKTAPKVELVSSPSASSTTDKPSNIDVRLAIPLDAEGRVLVENMRETSKEKLKGLLSDPKLRRELGLGAESGVDAPMALRPELMYPLVGGLSILETLIVAKMTRAPRELVERIVPYSREEVQAIAPALAAVIEKHGGGTWLAKYREEVDLGGLLIAMTIQKVTLIREELAKLGPRPVVVPFTGDAPTPARPEDPQV